MTTLGFISTGGGIVLFAIIALVVFFVGRAIVRRVKASNAAPEPFDNSYYENTGYPYETAYETAPELGGEDAEDDNGFDCPEDELSEDERNRNEELYRTISAQRVRDGVNLEDEDDEYDAIWDIIDELNSTPDDVAEADTLTPEERQKAELTERLRKSRQDSGIAEEDDAMEDIVIAGLVLELMSQPDTNYSEETAEEPTFGGGGDFGGAGAGGDWTEEPGVLAVGDIPSPDAVEGNVMVVPEPEGEAAETVPTDENGDGVNVNVPPAGDTDESAELSEAAGVDVEPDALAASGYSEIVEPVADPDEYSAANYGVAEEAEAEAAENTAEAVVEAEVEAAEVENSGETLEPMSEIADAEPALTQEDTPAYEAPTESFVEPTPAYEAPSTTYEAPSATYDAPATDTSSPSDSGSTGGDSGW